MSESVLGIEMPPGEPHAVEAAAQSMTRVAGGFERTAGVASRAVASVPSWDGLASINFTLQCGDYGEAARQAHTGCSQGATLLKTYAHELTTAKHQIRQLQHQAQVEDKKRQAAAADLAEAQGRYRGASMSAKMSAFESVADGGAALQAAQHEMDRAQADMTRAGTQLGQAEGALEQLRSRGKAINTAIRGKATTTAGQVHGVMEQMPTVMGGQGTSSGSTTTSADQEKISGALTIVIVKIGADRSLIRERHADGTWTVTDVKGIEGGVAFDPAPGVSFTGDGAKKTGGKGKLGGLGGSPDFEAAYLAQYESGKTFEFGNQADADRYIQAQKDGNPPAGGTYNPYGSGMYFAQKGDDKKRANWAWAEKQKPKETYSQGGETASLDASATEAGSGGSVSGSLTDAMGTKHAADGSYTNYYKQGASGSAGLTSPIAHATAKGGVESTIGISYDRAGHPTGVTVTSAHSGDLSSGLDLKGEHGDSKVGLGGSSGEGSRTETETHLGVLDNADRHALQRYLDSNGTDTAALQHRLDANGHTTVRVYSTTEDSTKINVDGKILKFEAGDSHSTSVLDGTWEHTGSGQSVKIGP